MSDLEAWDQHTVELLAQAYLSAGSGPEGSGSSDPSEGAWRAKRQHLCDPMDASGTWLDVGCANGHLLITLPRWVSERGVTIEAHGLELIPAVAGLARNLHPELSDRIWTGSVVSWTPPRRFSYVTVTDDVVPPERLGDLIDRVLTHLLEPAGRLIISSYTNRGSTPRALFDDLERCGHPPTGTIHIDRPNRPPLLTAWIDGTAPERSENRILSSVPGTR